MPRILVAPDSASSAGTEAVDLAAHAGLILDPWQRFVLEVGLGERPDGQWSAFEVACIVARQNGKGSIFEALALAKLVLFGSQLFIYSSHEFKTSREAFGRIGRLIESTPEFRARVLRTVKNPSEHGYDFRNGARLRFFARSSGSGRGWSADDLFFDEAFKLGSDAMAALLPTLSTRPNPQVWYASSAALADSEQLHKLRRRALRGEGVDRLAYLEWSAPETCDPADPQSWAQANPAIGYRMTEEFMASQFEALGVEGFRREHLSIPDDPETQSAALDLDAWNASADPESRGVDPVSFALEVPEDRSWAAVMVGAKRDDGRYHGAVVDYRRGTEWVVDRVVALNEKWRPAAFVVNPASPAGAYITEIEARGVKVTKPSVRDFAQACGWFSDLVSTGDFRHRDEVALNVAVKAAKRRTVGEQWVFDQKASADVSPLRAAVLACWSASREKPRPSNHQLLASLY